MSVSACAEIVRRGDPDRFLAAMATSPSVRKALFPVYAFNVEISRAAWLMQEPMTARIRLQWWRDALEEIASDDLVRNQEVTVPLADVLDTGSVGLLDELIGAQLRIVDGRGFETEDHLSEYLNQTAGNLTLAAARAIGVTESDSENAIREIAWASGLANLFLAVPKLTFDRHGLFPDLSPAAVQRMAARGIARISNVHVSRRAKPALVATWRAHRILQMAHRFPERVMSGNLGGSEFMRRASLLWHIFVKGRFPLGFRRD